MELRHIRYFCAVADWQGFNRAARALRVSQSAISEQILDLEREIGTRLLNRKQRSLSLTPAGEIFLEEARKILADAERAIDRARRTGRGEIGALRTGFLVWGASSFLPRVIREFRDLHPGVRLSLVEMLPAAQSEALLRGTLDVGFTRPLQPPYAASLRSETLFHDPLIAVLPADHPRARDPLPLRALADEPFVLCEREISPTLFDKITSLCALAGFSPRIAQTSNVLSSVLALVEAGEGVTLIPSSLRNARFSDLAFCPLSEPQGTIELVMAWSPEREGALRTAFLEFVRSRKELVAGAAGMSRASGADDQATKRSTTG